MIIKPNYKIENKLYKRGFEKIAGLDEAGRGSWAGPVVAAAVILPPKLKIPSLRDSKLLSPQKREELFVYINKNALGVGVGVISEKIIDKEGIIGATRKAFLEAVETMQNKIDYLLVDGLKIFEHDLPVDFIVRGDNKSMSIAAASIIAKVTRDDILKQYHKQYPEYEFHKHKGYGTKLHRQALDKYGICDIHRLSYEPVMRSM